MKYAINFPLTTNKNNNISLFDTGATIFCMAKPCFDKLQPKPTLVQTNTYKVNGADGNSLGLIRMTTCTHEFLLEISTTIHHLQTLTLTCYSRFRLLSYLINWN